MLEPAAAAWIALGAAVGALAIVVVASVVLVRQWRMTQRTQRAARALVDVHRQQIESKIDDVAERAAAVGASGAELVDAVEELRADVRHVTWLLGRIPEARDTLRDTVLDIVLPTPARSADAKGRCRERA